jgi:hypothetical protein
MTDGIGDQWLLSKNYPTNVIMMKIKTFFLPVLLLSILACCSEDDKKQELTVDISGAEAFAFFDANKSAGGRIKQTPQENEILFKIDADGNITPASEGVAIGWVRTIRDGVLLYAIVENGVAPVWYVVNRNNEMYKFDRNMGEYVGENDEGDLIFADGTIFRRSTQTLDKIQSSFDYFTVQAVSGNFAIIISFRPTITRQVVHTVSGVRRNLCDVSYQIIAIDNDKVFVGDCNRSGSSYMNITDGTFTETGIYVLNTGTIRTPTGFATVGEDQTLMKTMLREYNTALTTTFETEYTPESVVKDMSTTGDYFIIKELNRITAVKRGESAATVILSEVNVLSYSVGNGRVYYLAEDLFGNPVTGYYELTSGENVVLSDDMEFNTILTQEWN